MRRLTLLLVLALSTGLMWTNGSAAVVMENHYMAYSFIGGGASVTGPIILTDQFGTTQHTFALLERFANPVDKNHEGIFDPLFHQTWWAIDDPQVPRTVVVTNQFGSYTWTVQDGRYLVLPATKNQTPPEPPPQDILNHYKCYDATGPILQETVSLVDQFLNLVEFPLLPLYLCNPVQKQSPLTGEVTEIVDPDMHLACYQMVGFNVFVSLTSADQFGARTMSDLFSEFFCVPSQKEDPTPAEESSWGVAERRDRLNRFT